VVALPVNAQPRLTWNRPPPDYVQLACPKCGHPAVRFIRSVGTTYGPDGSLALEFARDTRYFATTVTPCGRIVTMTRPPVPLLLPDGAWVTGIPATTTTGPSTDRLRVRCARCRAFDREYGTAKLEALATETGSAGRKRARLP